MKKMRREALKFGPPLITLFMRLLFRTIRWKELYPEQVRPILEEGHKVIYCFWHGRMLMTPFFYSGNRAAILISHHFDGELISRTLSRFGVESVRGSSKRGGYGAFRKMITLVKDGNDLAITPDGPRGPRHRVHRGTIELARKSGLPIVPVTYSTKRKKICSSWDGFLIPYPFTMGIFVWGEPLWVDSNGGKGEIEGYRLLLENRMNEMTALADSYF